MHALIQTNLFRIPNTVDLVIGIPRSGLVPASHIATSLNLPLQTLNDISLKHPTKQIFTMRSVKESEKPNHVLVVDDTSNTGGRMRQAIELINRRWNGTEITTLAICAAQNASYRPDLSFFESTTPRIFAWNMFNHEEMTSRIATDLDGVLCVDPTHNQNDDGRLYKEFLRDASLKLKPYRKVEAVITGRLEKYRYETEDWLAQHSIEYGNLYMNDASSASFRAKKKYKKNGLLVDQISEFKSRILKAISPPLFIESNLEQAFRINRITRVNTYAFDHDQYFGSDNYGD